VVYVLLLIAAISSFVLNIVLGRILGAEGTGLYYLCFTITSLAALFSRFGLDNTLIRFMGSYTAAGDWGKVKGTYISAIVFSFLISVSLCLIIYLASNFISVHIFNEKGMTQPLKLMIISIIPFSLFLLNSSSLRALKKVGYASLIQNVLPKVLPIILISVLAYTHGVAGATFSFTISSFLIFIFSIFICYHYIKLHKNAVKNVPIGQLLQVSFPLLITDFFNLFILHSATIVLGIFEGSKEVGIYSVAARISQITNIILVSVNSMAAPQFAELWTNNDLEGLKKVAKFSARIMTLFATPVLFVFLFFPEFVLSLFGEGFKEGRIVLLLLAFGQFVNVSTGSVGYILIMTGNEKSYRNIIIVCAIFCVLFNVLFVNYFGLNGAAIATSAIISIQYLALMISVFRKFGFFTIPFTSK